MDVRRGWIRFLRRFRPDHVGHFTTRFERCPPELLQSLLTNWSDGLGRITQKPVAWIAFPEATYAGRYHAHALIFGTAGIPVANLMDRWRYRYGKQVKVEPYIPLGGIERYVTKECSVDNSAVLFSSNFVRVSPSYLR